MLQVQPTGDLAQAMSAALDEAGQRDLICIAGSVYLAGEALRLFAMLPTEEGRAIEIAGIDHP